MLNLARGDLDVIEVYDRSTPPADVRKSAEHNGEYVGAPLVALFTGRPAGESAGMYTRRKYSHLLSPLPASVDYI